MALLSPRREGRYTTDHSWKLKGSRVEPSSPAQLETTMTRSTRLQAIPSLHSPFRQCRHLQAEDSTNRCCSAYWSLIENYLNKGEAEEAPDKLIVMALEQLWTEFTCSRQHYKALLSILAQPGHHTGMGARPIQHKKLSHQSHPTHICPECLPTKN